MKKKSKKDARMRDRRITGYTNNTAAAFIRGNDINANHLCFCPESRYKKCCKEKICDRLEPRCTFDEYQFLGKDYKACREPTKADKAKIKRMLAVAVKRCRPVVVTLVVDKGK